MMARTGPARVGASRGLLLGLATALAWALYNVGVAKGHQDGFGSVDLTFLRYGVASVLLIPVLVRGQRRPSLAQAVVVTALIGPGFTLLLNLGFSLAPLSHAVVVSPGVSMLTTTALAWGLDGRTLSAQRAVGIGLLVLGLLAVSAGGTRPDPAGTSSLWGDLCFVATGLMWGTMTWVVGRWQLPPSTVAAAVAVLSSLVLAPAYLALGGPPDLSIDLWIEQALYQGVIGWSVAFLAFGATVQALGAGRAAVFSALVPPLAVGIGIPATGVRLDLMQWLGVGLASIGLMVSLGRCQSNDA